MKINHKNIIFSALCITLASCVEKENPSDPFKAAELPANSPKPPTRLEALRAKCVDNAKKTAAEAIAYNKKNRPDETEYLLRPCLRLEDTPNQIRQLHAAANKKLDAIEKKRRKSEGVQIGMTQAQVLDSSWGKPERINRTTTTHGTREQWVYGGRNYLYFHDGILTAIQN